MAEDMHFYGKKLASYLKRLDGLVKTQEDRMMIRSYLDHLKAQGLSTGRLYKIAWTLIDIRKKLSSRTFKSATRKEIERLVAEINSSEYTANTKSDHKKILKKFYKFVRYGNGDRKTQYPPEVAWVDTSIKRNELKEPDVITEDEARRMIEAATSTRDKALIAVAYEGGFRIGELLGMEINDVSFDDNGARVNVSGKTGPRVVRLMASAPLLGRYIDEHPFKENPGSPLWINPLDSRRNAGKRMAYMTTREAILRVAGRAGIKKRIYPHLFRHSAATRDASYNINERLLEIRYGWTKGSRMAARYTHIKDEKTVDEALLSLYSGKEIKPPEPKFHPVICPRCSEKNSPGVRFCGRCGTPLDQRELTKASVELEDLKAKVDEILKRLESRK
jgi:integrase/recombinase XerD